MRAMLRLSHRSFLASSLLVVAVFFATEAFSVSPASAAVISFDFSSLTGASVMFTGTGNKIEFPADPSGYDFTITDATSPILGGLQGNIGGTFTVGTINPVGTMAEQAVVTTTDGVFSIDDGVGSTLTGNLDWTDIIVVNKVVGALNVTGDANLTGIAYSGSNDDLSGIKDASEGTVILTFQFSIGAMKSLSELMTNGQVSSTSYSGSASVPEPASLALVSAGLGILMLRRRRRR